MAIPVGPTPSRSAASCRHSCYRPRSVRPAVRSAGAEGSPIVRQTYRKARGAAVLLATLALLGAIPAAPATATSPSGCPTF